MFKVNNCASISEALTLRKSVQLANTTLHSNLINLEQTRIIPNYQEFSGN